jgi:hypothetical protein
MNEIYDDAWNGKLDQSILEQFLSANPNEVNAIHGSKGITLLCAATRSGSFNLVRMLIDNPHAKANPNTPCAKGRYPLYYATTRSPLPERAAIVRALLNSGANVNTCSTDSNESTPLMNAIVQARDAATVEELIDHGADTQIVKKGKTAVELAKNTPLAGSLLPKDQRNASRSNIVNGLLATVIVIIGYVNAIVGGTVKRLFNIAGLKVPVKVRSQSDCLLSAVINYRSQDLAKSVKEVSQVSTSVINQPLDWLNDLYRTLRTRSNH